MIMMIAPAASLWMRGADYYDAGGRPPGAPAVPGRAFESGPGPSPPLERSLAVRVSRPGALAGPLAAAAAAAASEPGPPHCIEAAAAAAGTDRDCQPEPGPELQSRALSRDLDS
jgi:hypothetical protein